MQRRDFSLAVTITAACSRRYAVDVHRDELRVMRILGPIAGVAGSSTPARSREHETSVFARRSESGRILDSGHFKMGTGCGLRCFVHVSPSENERRRSDSRIVQRHLLLFI